MFKAISRGLKTEQKSVITLKVIKVGTEVENDCEVQVIWKRGPEIQEGKKVDLNNIEVDAELEDVFTKASSFYTSGGVWEPKMCEF